MIRTSRRQHGATLLVVLIMLVMVTLFVVSMIQLSNTNASVVGNMQAQRMVETEAAQAVEIATNRFDFFSDVINNQNAWASSKTSLTLAELWTAYPPTGASSTTPAMQSTITVTRPQCIYATTATGYSALSNVSPQDTAWDLQVNAVDSISGAVTEIHQGVRMRLPSGSC